MLNNLDYKILEELDILSDGKLVKILNANGGANLTVCPECRVDDFTHAEDCLLSEPIKVQQVQP